MRYLVTFLLDLTVFGAGVPNILVGMWTFQASSNDSKLPSNILTSSITEPRIDRTSDKQWRILFFILLLAHNIGHLHVSNHVAWKSEEYEVSVSCYAVRTQWNNQLCFVVFAEQSPAFRWLCVQLLSYSFGYVYYWTKNRMQPMYRPFSWTHRPLRRCWKSTAWSHFNSIYIQCWWPSKLTWSTSTKLATPCVTALRVCYFLNAVRGHDLDFCFTPIIFNLTSQQRWFSVRWQHFWAPSNTETPSPPTCWTFCRAAISCTWRYFS